MAYNVKEAPVMRTSEASRTTHQDMNRICARINHMLSSIGASYTSIKTTWARYDIVNETTWHKAVDYVKTYASEYSPEPITYSTHYKNLNNIEMACWARVYQNKQNLLPFNLQEGNEWQL